MNPSAVDLRVWRQFLTLAEELHFGRAAARLHMTQPPLTQAIAQLEVTLGLRLFERSRRHVALTPAAQALLPEVRELLARARRLPDIARAAASGEVGRLRLAFVSTVGFEQLPGWVRGLREHAPQVALELIEATGDLQQEALARGEIDAGVLLHTPGFAPAAFESLHVAEEPLVLALPAGHALAVAPRLSLARVLEQPLVQFPRRILPSIHDALFALYHAQGRPPLVVQEAIQMQTIVNLVAAGLGLAWVPRSVTRFERQGVVYRELSRADVPRCETRLVWRRGDENPVLVRFVDLVRTLAQSRPC
ncbi:MAG: LysR family transcriptional regulator [Burkholderiaceae bacterium]|nr:LysR family transcriptional regulator [Burkholderiaceae bacterium]